MAWTVVAEGLITRFEDWDADEPVKVRVFFREYLWLGPGSRCRIEVKLYGRALPGMDDPCVVMIHHWDRVEQTYVESDFWPFNLQGPLLATLQKASLKLETSLTCPESGIQKVFLEDLSTPFSDVREGEPEPIQENQSIMDVVLDFMENRGRYELGSYYQDGQYLLMNNQYWDADRYEQQTRVSEDYSTLSQSERVLRHRLECATNPLLDRSLTHAIIDVAATLQAIWADGGIEPNYMGPEIFHLARARLRSS